MKALIIEDEPRAANRLTRVLNEVAPEIEILAKLETIKDSVHYLNQNNDLDVIFSDIQLSDGLSFEIFNKVAVNCPIIFTTAFNQYAINAFDTNGIDYILKPVESERIEKSIKKLKNLSKKENTLNLDQIKALTESLTTKKSTYKSRFAIKVGSKIISLNTSDILAFYSKEKATYLFTKQKRTYCLDYSLTYLETVLDPALFFKTSRKQIVSLDSLQEIITYSNSRLKIRIEGLEEEIIVAREKVAEFKQWIGE